MTDPVAAARETPAGAAQGLAWSRYNRLFETPRYGHFLYNALSNELLKLDGPHARAVAGLRAAAAGREPGADAAGADGAAGGEAERPDVTDDGLAAAFARLAAAEPEFAEGLRAARVVVTPGQEEGARLAAVYRRRASRFDTATLGLTVCPTLACNFRCGYCFEHSQDDGATMSADTVDRLLEFIGSFEDLSRVSLAWYGGEPTLAWDVVGEVTRRIREAGFDDLSAGLVTNGYLLDREKIAGLDELGIVSLQITLDGPAEVHDRRRVPTGGAPTFDRILANVDALMESSWSGRCSIRVNVDRENRDLFLGLRDELLRRYAGKRLSVYAGHVHPSPADGDGPCAAMSSCEWADFTLALYAEASVLPVRGFYPRSGPGGCVANAHLGFVVGPRGELYKCWEDVGRPDMEVGSVHADGFITDPVLRARYAVGTDPEEDPDCRACDVLPVCDGGCPNKRLWALQRGARGVEYCPPYKDHLEEYLEAYYDALLTREICAAVLAPGRPEKDDRGWRVLTPDPASAGDRGPLAGPVDTEE